jgi:uncharacterized protein (DUF58 family)
MNLKEIERVVGLIQSHIFKNSNAYSTGVLKSHFRGSGLQFREHQVYVPGDDVRFIDWKLSARSANTYIKTFEEERNVEMVVFLDISQTLFYGYKEISKLQAMIEIVALLYLLAAETHDLVRVTIWSDKALGLPPKNGKEGLTLFISMLERLGYISADGKVINNSKNSTGNLTEIQKIAQIKSFLARRKEVIYLGDLSLMNDKNLWNKLLDKKNMHCYRIFSPVDKNQSLPFLFKARNPLSGKNMVSDMKASELKPMFTKERFKEIGVHERYLEKFVRELV